MKYLLTFVFICFSGVLIFYWLSHGLYDYKSKTQDDKLITTKINDANNMKIISDAFENSGYIPSKYTCDGQNINPPLMFLNVPGGAKSLVLIMYDPDVPKNIRPDGVWDHWIVFNLSPKTTNIEEGSQPDGISGQGTGGKTGYTGPCPPDREHRYYFDLYALDSVLTLSSGAKKDDVLSQIDGHILSEAELMGRYVRK